MAVAHSMPEVAACISCLALILRPPTRWAQTAQWTWNSCTFFS